MANSTRAVILGASVEQFSHIHKCLPAWECVNLPLDGSATMTSLACKEIRLAILYARKRPESTVFICKGIRDSAEFSNVPILLVVSRYQMGQANAVRDMANVSFIIAPFSEKEIHDKIIEIAH